MTEPKNSTLDIANAQQALEFKEKLVDKDLQQVELRLTNRINEVKVDLIKEIDQVKKDLKDDKKSRTSNQKWFIGILFVAIGIIASLIVALIK